MKHTEFLTLNIDIEEKDLDFSLARRLADKLVSERISEPMLIAWYDGKKGEEHPHVPECQHEPGWLAYAEGHGGRVRIDVNKTEYSFIYADVDAPSVP